MRVAVLVLALFGCFATSSRVQCQGFKDVAEIKFVVDLNDEAKALGFTKQGLADEMGVVLKRELPELKFNKTADSSLYISIGVMQSDGCEAAVVYISFRRSVRVADQTCPRARRRSRRGHSANCAASCAGQKRPPVLRTAYGTKGPRRD